MLQVKTAFPEEGELVLCTVTKVQFHSVFVSVDEFRRGGMIHISEVSPGRIRNLRDFVKEGKVIICKVLRVDKERGHIDLSLRRVSEGQRRNKVNEIKQEQKAEKILEFVGKLVGKKPEVLYEQMKEPLLKNFDSLYPAFEAIAFDQFSVDKLGLDKTITPKLVEIIKQRIKQPEVEIGGDLSLQSFASDGIEQIKNLLINIEKKHSVKVSYKAAGKYMIKIVSTDYKSAEKTLKDATDEAVAVIEEQGGLASFARAEK